MNRIKTLIREPFILFFILGIIMYLGYNLTTGYFFDKSREIVVNQTEIALLEDSFRKTWNREPTDEEVRNIIENKVMDEVFFKQAVAMGLDKSDPVVKRRLRQIMELMLDDMASMVPTENQLQKYLSENPEKFQKEPRFSFTQLSFPMERREEAVDLLSDLQKGISGPEDYAGGMYLLPSTLEDERQYEVERLFGTDFAQEISTLEVGSWQGPVVSAYGWHLVYLNRYVPAETPNLNEVWDDVEREWSVERKKAIKKEQHKILRDQYEVKVTQSNE